MLNWKQEPPPISNRLLHQTVHLPLSKDPTVQDETHLLSTTSLQNYF